MYKYKIAFKGGREILLTTDKDEKWLNSVIDVYHHHGINIVNFENGSYINLDEIVTILEVQ